MKHGRLIDADALMRDVNEALSEMTSIGIAVDGDWLWAKLNDAIEHAPTIEERKKGEWIPEFDGKFAGGAYWFSCSKCKRIVPEVRNGGWNYCPNCGADMRGIDE